MRVLPIPGIEWQINPDWKLATAQGLTLTRKINRRWQADFGSTVDIAEVRGFTSFLTKPVEDPDLERRRRAVPRLRRHPL